jgi:hypothetical protein
LPRTPHERIPNHLQLLSSRFEWHGKILKLSALMVGTKQVVEKIGYACHNIKDKVIISHM